MFVSPVRVPADQRRHHCSTRSGVTWRLAAHQCVVMATAAGCFPATTATAAATATTTAATKSCLPQQLGVSIFFIFSTALLLEFKSVSSKLLRHSRPASGKVVVAAADIFMV